MGLNVKKTYDYKTLYTLSKEVVEVFDTTSLKYCVCGAVRRKSHVGNGLDIIILEKDYPKAIAMINNNPYYKFVSLPTTATGRMYEYKGILTAFYPSTEDVWGAMQLFLTGNRLFTRIIRGRARDMECKLTQHGLFFNGELLAGKSEEQILFTLGVDYIPPENRNFSSGSSLSLVRKTVMPVIRDGL
jgi:DNA polymerase/3'-5' exonuclease PolX